MKYPVFFLSIILLFACSKLDKLPLQQWQHVAHGSFGAALSDNGRYAVVSSTQHGVAFWDIADNALKYQWQHKESEENLIFNVAISHNNSHVLTADRLNFALWRTSDGSNAGFWQLDEATIRDIAVSDNGEHLLIGKSNGGVQHITIASGRRLEFLGHTERINSVAMSPNGRYALTGSNDYMAYLWDTESGQIIYSFSHPSRVSKVALDPQGRYAFTADSLNLAQIWDIQTGQPLSKLQFVRQQIFSAVRFSPDGKWLATGAPNRRIVLWDIATGKEKTHWYVSPRTGSKPPSAVVHDVAFYGANQIISESSSGLAELWEFSINEK